VEIYYRPIHIARQRDIAARVHSREYKKYYRQTENNRKDRENKYRGPSYP